MFNWKKKEDNTNKVKLEGCLDTSNDVLQWCSHGLRTDAYCSQCERTKSKSSLDSMFDSNSFGRAINLDE